MVKQGFLQALGVAIYCVLVGTFLWNSQNLFGRSNTFLAPIALLTLFSTSALICALTVLYKPYKLFFVGKKKEALDIVISTTAFLFLFLVLLLTTLFLTK